MFSKRVSFNLHKNQLTLLLEEKRRSNVHIIDLTESNPTVAGFNYPEKALLTAISHKDSLIYSPSAKGLEATRNAISEYYSERGITVSAEDIVLTSSTSEAYSFLFKLLIDPGDQILIPRPSYPLFDFLARLECARTVRYPLHYQNGWYYDLETLESCLSQRTKAIVLVNPNNPTGSYIDQKEWEGLRDLCLARRVTMICDEVFVDYCISDALHPFDPASATDVPTFLLNGLSKTSGLPQMKLGWIIVQGPAKQRRERLEHLEIVADTFLSVSTPIQHAVPILLEIANGIRGQIQRRIRTNYGFLLDSCSNTAVQCLITEGGWYASLRLPRIKSEEEWILHFLESADTLVYPGYFYDFAEEAYVVLSLLPNPNEFEEGVKRLLEKI